MYQEAQLLLHMLIQVHLENPHLTRQLVIGTKDMKREFQMLHQGETLVITI